VAWQGTKLSGKAIGAEIPADARGPFLIDQDRGAPGLEQRYGFMPTAVNIKSSAAPPSCRAKAQHPRLAFVPQAKPWMKVTGTGMMWRCRPVNIFGRWYGQRTGSGKQLASVAPHHLLAGAK
jgi:hypothetical protein